MLEAVPPAALGAPAIAAQIRGPVIRGHIVLAGDIEDTVRAESAEDLRGGVELLGSRELRDVAGVQNERGALRQRIDLRDGLLQGGGDVLVRFLAEADVAVAHLDEEDALPLGRREKVQAAEREGFRDATGQPPDCRRSRPCHTAQKAASVDAVLAAVARDVVAARGARVSLLVEPMIVTVSVVVHRCSLQMSVEALNFLIETTQGPYLFRQTPGKYLAPRLSLRSSLRHR